MRYKTRTVRRHFNMLERMAPALQALLLWIDHDARQMFRKDILITSIHRDDGSSHTTWRMADLRIERNRDRNRDLTDDEWMTLARRINKKFIYGRTQDGRRTRCVHVLTTDPNPFNHHVHVQVPDTRWHGTRTS